MWSLRPALPSHSSPKCPSGSDWVHEVKHDGYRVIARKEDKRVKLYSRRATTSRTVSRKSPRPSRACAHARASSMARRSRVEKTASRSSRYRRLGKRLPDPPTTLPAI